MTSGLKKVILEYNHGKRVVLGYRGDPIVVQMTKQPNGYQTLTIGFGPPAPRAHKTPRAKPRPPKRRDRSTP